MKKEYVKPEIECVSLCSEEDVALLDPEFGSGELPEGWE